jgi:hypothetical protein
MGQAARMTKDDKLLRETVLAELKRRRGLPIDGQDRDRHDPGPDRRTVRLDAEVRRQLVGQR